MIRFDGIAGVGKTGLAKLLKERVDGEHVAADDFVNKFDEPPAYRECLRQAEFDAAIETAVASGRVVILDALCLDEVAPIARWGRGLAVYVKRLSFNNSDPIWHYGFHSDEEPPADKLHHSIDVYHDRVKPHETADLIVELADDGHTMTKGGYSRDMCFDPPGAELI